MPKNPDYLSCKNEAEKDGKYTDVYKQKREKYFLSVQGKN